MNTVKPRQAISSAIYVGAVGTFFGGLPGEPIQQATGKVEKILEGRDFAVVSVRCADGSLKLLRK